MNDVSAITAEFRQVLADEEAMAREIEATVKSLSPEEILSVLGTQFDAVDLIIGGLIEASETTATSGEIIAKKGLMVLSDALSTAITWIAHHHGVMSGGRDSADRSEEEDDL
jgi:phage-related protein